MILHPGENLKACREEVCGEGVLAGKESHQSVHKRVSTIDMCMSNSFQGEQMLEHLKMLPECRNVTKQNCVTLWQTDPDATFHSVDKLR